MTEPPVTGPPATGPLTDAGQVSYWTLAGERRRGYAARALALLLEYARSLGVTRLESHVAPDNHASRRVSEKNGFRPAGTFRDDAGTLMIRYELPLPSPPGRPQ